ncbi:MAG: NADH-quinone oxidoreductase subunit C, partial [Eggerthellaceae bacterium]|nr:NADH-quinone oxidoreductase subunit C [Eggerthellaceae bacterium]
MTRSISFTDIALDKLVPLAQEKHDGGWRCIQMHCVTTDNGIDLTYTFDQDGVMENYRVRGVQESVDVPSLQPFFISLFPFENEANELFGVNIVNMKIDFGGHLYALAQSKPMTIISPAQKAAKDKAAKIARAKAAKAAKANISADGGKQASSARSSQDSANAAIPADLQEKLNHMSPEKAQKVRDAIAKRTEKQ